MPSYLPKNGMSGEFTHLNFKETYLSNLNFKVSFSATRLGIVNMNQGSHAWGFILYTRHNNYVVVKLNNEYVSN